MWMREPVEPASIMSAYCTSGEDESCGTVQKTVLLGSGSDSCDDGRGAWAALDEGVAGGTLSISGLCGSIMGCGGGKWASVFAGAFHTAERRDVSSFQSSRSTKIRFQATTVALGKLEGEELTGSGSF